MLERVMVGGKWMVKDRELDEWYNRNCANIDAEGSPVQTTVSICL